AVAFAITGTPYGGNVVRTHTETYTDAFGPLTFTSTQAISFTGVQSLVIEGGSTGNTFDLVSIPTGTDTFLDGGAGSNARDYSPCTGDVAANLSLGTATGFAAVTNIQNVNGSIGNDILVGDGNANVLVGGTGRNLIIGGAGADQLFGGGDENIQIGGSTAYDGNLTALQAIIKEVNRTDRTFHKRREDLANGGGLNGSFVLNVDPTPGPVTVFDDGAGDVLTAGGSLDWFIVHKKADVINNRQPGDKITQA